MKRSASHLALDALFAASTWQDTRAALDAGANVNARDDKGRSALIRACSRHSDWLAWEAIAHQLIAANAVVNMHSERRALTPLHYAACHSSAAMVELLIAAKAAVDPLSTGECTPLIIAVRRTDGEAHKIAALLLEHGAQLERSGKLQNTPLLQACRVGTVETVRLLLSRKANVNAVTDTSALTPMMQAMHNFEHGVAILGALVCAGADLYASNADGENALIYACSSNGTIMRAVASFYPATRRGALASFLPDDRLCADPIGVLREGAAHGASMNSTTFMRDVRDRAPPLMCWAHLRLALERDGETVDSVFEVMATCADPVAWKWVAIEMGTNVREPGTHNTLLHLAAHTNNAAAVRELVKQWANPLLRNRVGQTPIECATSPVVRTLLQEYAERRGQPLRREVLRWYGPYLEQRLCTFLLVLQRWRVTGIRNVSRDICAMIIERVRWVEYI